MSNVQIAELNSPFKCLLVDDNATARMALRFFIEKHPKLILAGECANGSEAQKVLNTADINILFLDVEMPDMTGLELLNKLQSKPAVIFTTVGRQYATNAFDVEAIDFLLKPIEYVRFCQAVEKAEKHFELTRLNKNPKDEMILLRDGKSMIQVNIHNIIRFEALGDYVKIWGDGRQFTIHSTMKELENKMQPFGFERVHRSHMVKLSAVVRLKSKSILTKAGEIPLSANYREGLLLKLAEGNAII